MKILITGISGKLSRTVATKLLQEGHTIFGIDRRPWPDAPKVSKYIAQISESAQPKTFSVRNVQTP